MRVPFFDLTRQYRSVESTIRTALDTVIESQAFIMGRPVAELEQSIANRLGVKAAIGCASGTDALLLPLKALECDPGDHVLVPSFTFFATAGAVVNAGLRPVFCDVDPITFNVTPETLEAAWTDRTRAVIPVHLFGQMAPMEPIMMLARARGVTVIEDFAQAFGASQVIGGRKREAGSVGDVGATSFFPTKNLGGFGDGGLVTTNDERIAQYVTRARTHGGVQMYDHEFVGTNSRLDTIQAAVVAAKLGCVDGWGDRRRRNAQMYRDILDEVEGVTTPTSAPGNEHTFNQFTIRTTRRDSLKEHLNAQNIGSKIYYPKPLHRQACFSDITWDRLPISDRLSEEVLSLPIFPELSPDEVSFVGQAVRRFHEQGGE